MCVVVVPLFGFGFPPIRSFASWVLGVLPSPCRCGFAVFFVWGFLMVSFSLSGASSFSRAAVVVASVSWCPASRSILVSSACGLSFVCRVRGSESVVVRGRALWSSLVASRKAGVPVVLGFRSGWGGASASGSFWFDAVGVVPAVAEPSPAARLATAWGVPVPA